MHYNEIKQGYFIARPNRFIAHIELDGQVEVCHVKNTGRCRELLTPRAVVYVECHHDPRRKKIFVDRCQKGQHAGQYGFAGAE